MNDPVITLNIGQIVLLVTIWYVTIGVALVFSYHDAILEDEDEDTDASDIQNMLIRLHMAVNWPWWAFERDGNEDE